MAHTRRQFLASAALAATGALTATAQAPSTNVRRNIVFIFTDDQRFDHFSFMGHPFLETPHLDALAHAGVIFDNAIVTTALCSPSRASILSGLYAHSHGVLDNKTALSKELPTCPKLLQEAGYATAFIGKWHMGGDSDSPQPGFNRWVSFRGQGVYENPTLNIDGEQRKTEGYTTDLLTDHAVDFIRTRDAAKPFCLYLAHKAVHSEFTPAPRHKGCYADKNYPRPASMADTDENYRGKPAWLREQRTSWHGVDGMYDKKVSYDEFVRAQCETMRAVDDSIGRIMETLREQGLDKSTLVVFTSDNGFQLGEHGLIDKRTMYEASIRVPLIVHCPELYAGGQRRAQLTANIDFAPTMLETAGVSVPATMHGRSFVDVLRDPNASGRADVMYEYFWERDFPHTPTVIGLRTQRYSFMRYHGVYSCYELYDLENDPNEMNNLLADFDVNNRGGRLDNVIRKDADPALRDLYVSLQERLFAIQKETGSLEEPSWMASHT